ncbi:GDSL esterase/lipase 1-like [Malania oleifera]|uniref:GDSL esterase/lipase 1-like n=1 Tax=Malania oleifera TaxID=397392 RepID=UPI0025AE5DFE|nr:GDSL esterase/lipase 1-like [Malania oleifera]
MARVVSSFLLCFLVAFCQTLLAPIGCEGGAAARALPRRRYHGHAAFFIFGDSLLDAGNNQYLTDNKMGKPELPYGETYFKNATGRVCDGRIVPDFLAEYAKLPLIPPYLQPGFDNYSDGANFASAGAGVLSTTSANLLNLSVQLGYFKEVDKKLKKQLGDAEARRLVSNAVYLISMGGNDYMHYNSLAANQSVDVTKSPYSKTYISMVLGNITSVVTELYKMGGRKFGFQSVGPLGCMPGTKASLLPAGSRVDCVRGPQWLAKMHNAAFTKALHGLALKLPGFKHALFDYYGAVALRTLYPKSYGFKVGKSACCGSGAYRGEFTCGGHGGTVKYELCKHPKYYMFFDSAHPTEAANSQLAELLWGGSPAVIGPYNLKQLFHQ